MRIIGLLGGIASGKSFVAEQFRQLGAAALDADRVGHEVLRLPAIKEAVRHQFGREVLNSTGEVDRKALGKIVFAPAPDGPRQLTVLEQITHPEIRRRLNEQVEQLAAEGVTLAVLDAPVLLKAGWGDVCDALVFVDCEDAVRRTRAIERGWTPDEFAAREAAQESLAEKRKRADYVLENSAGTEYTKAQIERLWHCLVG
jgi:dephospho-CoA kinase